jgi:F-type H+-transporting ATPase subunit alpha
MEEQAVALYAGVNGYLDEIPTEDVARFQDELREHLRADGDIYKTVRESGDLDDDVTEKLSAELDKVKSRFAPTNTEAA